MKKEIQNFEELESFLKKHNYTYPKNWKTKLKKIKRKDRNSSTWKDFRMGMYAVERTVRCLIFIKREMRFLVDKFTIQIEKIGGEKLVKLMTKHSLTYDIIRNKIWPEVIDINDKKFYLNLIKKGGKSYYKINFTPEVKRFEKLIGIKILRMIKLPQKKETIFQIIEDEYYWTGRYIYLGKPVEDKDSKNIFRKEAQEYFRPGTYSSSSITSVPSTLKLPPQWVQASLGVMVFWTRLSPFGKGLRLRGVRGGFVASAYSSSVSAACSISISSRISSSANCALLSDFEPKRCLLYPCN